jgi:hypothetical protein
MSASLIVLIPVVLLGLVTAVCFVGCGLHTHGFGFGPYEDPITNTGGIVSCWPLNDAPPSTTAVDIKNGFNGNYTMGPNVPYDPMNESAAAPGTFTLQATGIVPGDVQTTTLTPCASFNGGFVSVGFQELLNQGQFTVEAWVKPNWSTDEVATAPANRGVVASVHGLQGTGWVLFATADNFWAATIGLGPGQQFVTLKSGQPIVLGGISYLAMTFDGSKLSLFVTVVGDSSNSPLVTTLTLQPNTKFQPVQMPSTTPLFIGMSRRDLANGMFPFNGSIQDVAYYGVPLDLTVIQNHFNLGVPG